MDSPALSFLPGDIVMIEKISPENELFFIREKVENTLCVVDSIFPSYQGVGGIGLTPLFEHDNKTIPKIVFKARSSSVTIKKLS
jgi:hypothetical protein